MDHLARLRVDEAVAEPVREAAGGLLDVKLALEVIPLGRGDTRAAGWARTILEAARERVQPTAKA
jgi:hypothetical protein